MIRNTLVVVAFLAAAPALAQSVAPATAPTKPATPVTQAAHTARLDVNSATIEQLAALKGMTKPLAEAIVKGRPYKGMDELTTKKIIPDAIFAELRDHLTIGK